MLVDRRFFEDMQLRGTGALVIERNPEYPRTASLYTFLEYDIL